MDIFNQTLAWYFAGPAIALVMFLLTFSGHSFGVSANLRTACSILGMGRKIKFFDFNWKAQRWNLVFLGGALVGGLISGWLGQTSHEIHPDTIQSLAEVNLVSSTNELLPDRFMHENMNVGSILILLVGGVLIGFGARYAGGCTSGHAISGLSNLQLPSLIAVVGFFLGGLLMTHLLLAPIAAFLLG